MIKVSDVPIKASEPLKLQPFIVNKNKKIAIQNNLNIKGVQYAEDCKHKRTSWVFSPKENLYINICKECATILLRQRHFESPSFTGASDMNYKDYVKKYGEPSCEFMRSASSSVSSRSSKI